MKTYTEYIEELIIEVIVNKKYIGLKLGRRN
ncbi:hypothetical protein IYC_13284 [Clostridium sporogenes PA 3679]|nr:hypothetical protein IYC_13284 [Clostridium sporogenes PA 3679]